MVLIFLDSRNLLGLEEEVVGEHFIHGAGK
jgi:hypothetical protein